MFRFDCPGCGKRFKLQDDNDGKKGKCSDCGALFSIKKPEPHTEKTLCPKCHTPIEKGSVICIECGYNFRTGKKLVEKIKEVKPTADETIEEVSQLSKGNGLPLNVVISAIAGIIVLAIVLIFSLKSDPENLKNKKSTLSTESNSYAEFTDKGQTESESLDTEKPVEAISIAVLPQQVASPSEIYPKRHWDVFYYLAPDRPRDIVIKHTDEGHGNKYFEANVEIMRKRTGNKIIELFGRPNSIWEDFTKTFYFNLKDSEPKTGLASAEENLTDESNLESAQEVIVRGSLWIYGPLQIMMQNKTTAYMWISGEEEIDSPKTGEVLSKIHGTAQFTDKVKMLRDSSLTIINKTPLDLKLEFGKDREKNTPVQPQGTFPVMVVQSTSTHTQQPKFSKSVSPGRMDYFNFSYEQDFSATVSFDDQDVSIKKSVFFMEPEAWIFTLKDSKHSPYPELIWTRIRGESVRSAVSMGSPQYIFNTQFVDLGDVPVGEFQNIETPSGVRTVKFSRDGGKIISGNNDGMLYLWDIKSGRKILEYIGHTGAVTCIALSPDGKLMVTGSEDNKLCLWDIGFGTPITTAESHSGTVLTLSWSPYNDLLLSGGDDRSIRLWNTADGQLSEIKMEFNNPLQNPGRVFGVEFQRFGYLINAVSSQSAASENPWLISRVYKLNGMPVSSTKKDIKSIARCMIFSKQGKYRLTGFGVPDGGLIFSELDSKSPKDTIFIGDEGKGIINDVALSSNNKLALSGGSQKCVVLWDTESGIPLALYTGHQDEVTGVDFSSSNRFAVSGSLDKTIRIYRLPERSEGLEYAIKYSNLEVQAKAIEILSKQNNRESRNLLISALNDENYLTQKLAAKALGTLGHKAAVKPLIKLIGGEEAAELKLQYSGVMNPNHAAGSAQKMILPVEYPEASTNNAKYEAMEALGKIGGDNAIMILFYWLNDKELGYMAMESLKKTTESSAISILTQFSMTDPMVAVTILSCIDQDNAKRTSLNIIKKILSRGEVEDKLKTIPMLKAIKTESALLELLKATGDQDLRSDAENALSDLELKNEIVFTGFINPIFDFLQNQDSATSRRIAAKILHKTEEPEAIVPLLKTLSDDSPLISGLAANALAQMVNPQALEKLISLLSDSDKDLQAGALSTLQKISAQQFDADPKKWQDWWNQNQEDFAEKYEEKSRGE